MEYYIWLIITAVIFTVVGYFMAWKVCANLVAKATVEVLIDEGYLKTSRSADGTVVIRKINEIN